MSSSQIQRTKGQASSTEHPKLAANSGEITGNDLQAEIATLKAQLSRHETVLETVTQGVCIFDGEQRLVLSNRRFAEIYRLEPEHVRRGTLVRDISEQCAAAGTGSIAASDYLKWCASIQSNAETQVWFSELTDGRTIRICHRSTPDGGFVATYEDATGLEADRRVANERLSLQTLIDWVPDYLWVKDTASRFIFTNKALTLDSGREKTSDMIGLSDFDLHAPELAQEFRETEQDILRTGQPMIDREERVVDSLGATRWLSSTKVPLRDEHNEIFGLVGIARDITVRKELELKVRESLQLLSTTLDSFPGGICMYDRDLTLMVANKSYYEINIIDEDWFPVGSKLEDILRYLAGRGDYGPIDVDAYALERVAEAQLFTPSEFQITRGDGGTIRYKRIPLEGGGCIMTFEDITERLKAEGDKSLLEKELVQAQRLESLGTLASGIAHEINTPIQYVGDNIRFVAQSLRDLLRILQLCRKSLRMPIDPGLIAERAEALRELENELDLAFILEELPLALDQSAQGVKQVATIVKAIKEFSHPGQEQKIEFDINSIIETTLIVSKNQWKYIAEVETDLDRTLPLVKCLPGEIGQVLLNLVVNAVHAIETAKRDSGLIRVSTRHDRMSVIVEIRDNGCGIPDAIKDRIYDPFFTTKDIGKGTGQGLSIAFNAVVHKHGGTIDCVSQEGEGATFTISLPIVGDELSQGAETVRTADA